MLTYFHASSTEEAREIVGDVIWLNKGRTKRKLHLNFEWTPRSEQQKIAQKGGIVLEKNTATTW